MLNSRLVVVPSLKNHQVIAVDEIHKPVLVIDSPRPTTLQNVPQRLRLANSGNGIPRGGLNKPVDPPNRRPVGWLPIDVICPTARREG